MREIVTFFRIFLGEVIRWFDTRLVSRSAVGKMHANSVGTFDGVHLAVNPRRVEQIVSALNLLKEHYPVLVRAMSGHVVAISEFPRPTSYRAFHYPGRLLVVCEQDFGGTTADLALCLGRKLWLNQLRHHTGFFPPCAVIYTEIKALQFEARASARICGFIRPGIDRWLNARLERLQTARCAGAISSRDKARLHSLMEGWEARKKSPANVAEGRPCENPPG